eukprot:m.54349 g.54349  ORF g.54349 m.54349 type:complete len:422 (+) comp6839_c0_seq1:52-1317(+)
MSSLEDLVRVNAVLCGTGEYTTGFVHDKASKSDKKIGVVALSMFELRRLGHVGEISLVGTNGAKFPAMRRHLKENISEAYNDLDVNVHTFPADDAPRSPTAYKEAIDQLMRGDVCTIFTPDDTHFEIAKYAISRGLHVLLTKPAVKTLAEHLELIELAEVNQVLVMIEFHKRWDPIYTDAVSKARKIGDFSFFHAFMSQPKYQLETFKAWAGVSSDISYYLNSHHIDLHCWMMGGRARPVSVTALKSTGIADSDPYNCPKGTEDTITLAVQWENSSGSAGHAMYTSSWAVPRADVHSQQRFHLICHGGEVTVDQAHRGYTFTTDSNGYASVNPLYMSYEPGPDGHFNGHHGYGYRSIEAFVKAARALNAKKVTLAELHERLPTLQATLQTTAILEAGRISLDRGGQPVRLDAGSDGRVTLV